MSDTFDMKEMELALENLRKAQAVYDTALKGLHMCEDMCRDTRQALTAAVIRVDTLVEQYRRS